MNELRRSLVIFKKNSPKMRTSYSINPLIKVEGVFVIINCG